MGPSLRYAYFSVRVIRCHGSGVSKRRMLPLLVQTKAQRGVKAKMSATCQRHVSDMRPIASSRGHSRTPKTGCRLGLLGASRAVHSLFTLDKLGSLVRAQYRPFSSQALRRIRMVARDTCVG
jgi:hypothetical protein